MPYCFTGITRVETYHSPNEGRDIWNNNFDSVGCAIVDLTISASTGSTVVASGDDNIEVALSGASFPPIYGVSLADDITVNSLSATTLSSDTYYVGSTLLGDYLTGSSVFVSGSTGNYSIRANNDSGVDATGNYAYAEGYGNLSSGIASHAEGGYFGKGSRPTSATTNSAHAEGVGTMASGEASHAEGIDSVASNTYSHAEGEGTTASGNASHAEGGSTLSSGNASHAEGNATSATTSQAHAQGFSTLASGLNSHASGAYTEVAGSTAYGGGSGWNSSIRLLSNGISSFAHFRITTTSEGNLGALSNQSAILGGENHNIASGAHNSAIFAGTNHRVDASVLRSAIIGGDAITATTNDTVYVPNLNIDSTPVENNVLTQILARDTDGTVRYRDVSSIITGATTASTQTLSQVLTEDNLTSDGQTIEAENGGGAISLRYGTDSKVLIDNSGSTYSDSGLYMENEYLVIFTNGYNTYLELDHRTNPFSQYQVDGAGGRLEIGLNTSELTLADNTNQDVSSSSQVKKATFLTTRLSTIGSGTTNSVVIGGTGHTINTDLTNTVIVGGDSITASESNAVYMPRMIGTRTDEAALNLPVMDLSFSSTTQGDVWISTGATNTFINVYVGGIVKSVELT